jgi:cell division septation protein DedD
MKNNETGEFELVLGNRQLLSGFFIVVILFAVFFVMGYIVGRNSSPATGRIGAGDQPGSGTASASDARPQPSGAPVQPPPQAAPASTAAEPAKDSPSESKSPTPPARDPEPKTETPASASSASAEPAPGEIYLQVMAVKQEEAEIVARTLKDKGFPSSTAPAPKGLTRVLVGPYTDGAALGKAKAELENAGFHPIVKKQGT